MRRPDTAAALLLSITGVLLVVDAQCCTKGQRTLTAAMRDNPWLTWPVATLIGLHVLGRLGRLDPFDIAAARLTRGAV
jgi:hypothetical protein